MKRIIKLSFFIIFVFCFFSWQKTVFADTKPQINIFYSTTCPHCTQARKFLAELKKQYPSIILNQYEVSKNNQLLISRYQEYKVHPQEQGLVPIIFLDKKYIIGFNEDIGQQINHYVAETLEKGPTNPNSQSSKKSKRLPFIGEIDQSKVALPVLAITFGFIDGFNVCSLGALLIILALVLSLKSRSKTLLYGGTFIFATALIYGLLIYFWYQLFTLIAPHLRKMELLISALTLGGGVYFFKEFLRFRKQGPTCGIGPAQKIEGRFSEKFQSLIKDRAKVITVFFSILIFAVIITLVEFPCSAAVPVAFAGILTKAQLSGWLYFFYIMLYVLFYMLDEIVIFLIAFFTSKLWLASPKSITWITLIESLILFALGLYYLFGSF